MKQAEVYVKGQKAGILIKEDSGKYIFRYDDDYLLSPAYDLLNTSLHIEDEDFALEGGN